MRFCYADPPYPGMAHLYKDHPDYAGEVDHKKLIERLVVEFPDGWALSTAHKDVRWLWPLCPDDTDLAVFIKVNEQARLHNRNPRRWSWEAVIFYRGRPRPLLEQERNYYIGGTSPGFQGQKSEGFCYWLFRCLGALPGDELVDLFPGSGAVGRAWDKYQRQMTLPLDQPGEKQVKLPI